MNDDNKFWTVSELAEKFGVHTSTLQGWIHDGHFPGAYKRGPGRNSPFAVPDSAVQAFEEKLKAGVIMEPA